MARLWLATAAAVTVLAACATSAPAPEASAEPSPRPECARATATIYFTEDSATLQPLAHPLLRDLMAQVQACQGAGGALRGITVTGYPDSLAGAGEARAEMEERTARVRAALIEHGAPADLIRTELGRRERGAIMQRRAEVVADLY